MNIIKGKLNIPQFLDVPPMLLMFPNCLRQEYENTGLFLRLGLPSIIIRHENGAFRKRSSKEEEFENASFALSCGEKTF